MRYSYARRPGFRVSARARRCRDDYTTWPSSLTVAQTARRPGGRPPGFRPGLPEEFACERDVLYAHCHDIGLWY